jgi:hypothetical protein
LSVIGCLVPLVGLGERSHFPLRFSPILVLFKRDEREAAEVERWREIHRGAGADLRRGGSPWGEEGHPPSRSLPRRRGVLSDVAGSSAPSLLLVSEFTSFQVNRPRIALCRGCSSSCLWFVSSIF